MTRLSNDRLIELFEGTLRLVAEHGFDKLTMDQIAAETRSSKATLYRRWGTKINLVVEAMRQLRELDAPLPDTGTLRGDLRALDDRKREPSDTTLISAILHAMRDNAELAEAVSAVILRPARARVGTLVERAVDRGEIAVDHPALPYVGLLLITPVALHPVVGVDASDREYAAGFYDDVLFPLLGVR